MSSLLRYRADIDGLRAVSVTAVVLFHLDLPGISGGFAGVDVFFVISGYLITALLLRSAREGQFSFSEFYVRRIKRILPALFLVLFCTIPFAFWLLLPGEMRDYSQSLAATAAFSSNMMFWQEAGYFAARSIYKPLLHTWSLGVEEQFYIVYPVLLMGLIRLMKARVSLVVGALAALSFAAAVYVGVKDTTSGFYLPQFRVWELFLGGLLALHARALPAHVSSWMTTGGLILIAASVLGVSGISSIPAFGALPATLGAALVIAGGEANYASSLLRWRPVAFLGRISYSVYLWHWPLISFLSYYRAGTLSAYDKLALLVVTILLATVTWKYVEQPARHSKWLRLKVFLAAFAGAVFFFGVGVAGYVAGGFPERFGEKERSAELRFLRPNTCLIEKDEVWDQARCTFGASGGDAPLPIVFLWGDSFAAQYAYGLERLQHELPFTLVQMTRAGCPPLSSLEKACDEFTKSALDRLISQRPALVIVAGSWYYVKDREGIARSLNDTLRKLKAANVPVVLIGESPVFASDVPMIDIMLKRRGENQQFFPTLNDFATDPLLRQVAVRHDAGFFSVRNYLCRGAVCRFSDGELLQFDIGHMTSHGSALLTRAMLPDIRAALARRGSR